MNPQDRDSGVGREAGPPQGSFSPNSRLPLARTRSGQSMEISQGMNPPQSSRVTRAIRPVLRMSSLTQLPPNGNYDSHALQDQIMILARKSHLTFKDIAESWFPLRSSEWVRKRYNALVPPSARYVRTSTASRAPPIVRTSQVTGLPPDGDDYANDSRKFHMLHVARDQNIRYAEIRKRWFPNTNERTLSTWANRRSPHKADRASVAGSPHNSKLPTQDDKDWRTRNTTSENDFQQTRFLTESTNLVSGEHQRIVSTPRRLESLGFERHDSRDYQPASGGNLTQTAQPGPGDIGFVSPYSAKENYIALLRRANQEQRAQSVQTSPYRQALASPGSQEFSPRRTSSANSEQQRRIQPIYSNMYNQMAQAILKERNERRVSNFSATTSNDRKAQLSQTQNKQEEIPELRQNRTYNEYFAWLRNRSSALQSPANEAFPNLKSPRHGQVDDPFTSADNDRIVYPGESQYGKAAAAPISFNRNLAKQAAESPHQGPSAEQPPYLTYNDDFDSAAESLYPPLTGNYYNQPDSPPDGLPSQPFTDSQLRTIAARAELYIQFQTAESSPEAPNDEKLTESAEPILKSYATR